MDREKLKRYVTNKLSDKETIEFQDDYIKNIDNPKMDGILIDYFFGTKETATLRRLISVAAAVVLIAVVVLTSMGIGIYSPLLWSMYADVADYATERFGTSSTGLIFSSGTMSQKLGGAISGSLIAALLGAAGLVSSQDMLTGETIVTITNEQSVQTMIWLLFSLIPAFVALVMTFLTYKYPIKK